MRGKKNKPAEPRVVGHHVYLKVEIHAVPEQLHRLPVRSRARAVRAHYRRHPFENHRLQRILFHVFRPVVQPLGRRVTVKSLVEHPQHPQVVRVQQRYLKHFELLPKASDLRPYGRGDQFFFTDYQIRSGGAPELAVEYAFVEEKTLVSDVNYVKVAGRKVREERVLHVKRCPKRPEKRKPYDKNFIDLRACSLRFENPTKRSKITPNRSL